MGHRFDKCASQCSAVKTWVFPGHIKTLEASENYVVETVQSV